VLFMLGILLSNTPVGMRILIMAIASSFLHLLQALCL
jgi:hypothetical protein